MESLLSQKIDDLERFSSRLKLIQPHQAFFLLRNSMSLPRLAYLLRTTDVAEHRLVSKYDFTLKESLTQLLNVRLSDVQWKQASLPVKHGGLGIRAASDVACPAFISSCKQSKLLAFELSGINHIQGEEQAILKWSTLTGCPSPDSFQQRDWDLPLIERAKVNVLDEAVDERNRARLLAVMSQWSGDWLNAIPVPSLGLMLNSTELRIAVALRLGARVAYPHDCASCGAEVGSEGLHGLSCRSSAGRSSRHQAANNIIKRTLASINVPSTLEPVGLTRRDGKRPDGLTLIP